MKKRRSIVYINFAPYDNAGRILDYLINNFYIVVHFSYDHLRLKNGRRSKLYVYKNKKIVYKKNLLWLRTYRILLFPSLPFVALIILLQTLHYVNKFHKVYGVFDDFLTVNAFSAWIGNILKKTNRVKKTIFWVWDYFPTNFPDWRLRIARKVYLYFDNPAISASDKVVMLNKKLLDVRRRLKIVPKNKRYPIVPIGTNPASSIPVRKKIIIGHLGMLKAGQGLDLLFDNIEAIHKLFPRLIIEIIGSGPEEEHFKNRAKKYREFVKFYGFIEDDNTVDKLMKKWSIGIATYVPFKGSEHYWTDPSKIKAYINQGVPVITTNVPEFAKEIASHNAGSIVNYNKQDELISSIRYLIKRNRYFSLNALKLAKKYDYRNLYINLIK